MLRRFLPDKQVNRFIEITPDFLISKGKKGIIIDLDNTLIPWNVADATDEIIEWMKAMEDVDIKVTVFSNNNEARVGVFAKPLGIPYVSMAKKPLKGGFRRAIKALELDVSEIVVIGDQLLTDILGGNRSKLYTILVEPIVRSDAPITMFNRRIERFILNRFYKQGKLTRGELDGK